MNPQNQLIDEPYYSLSIKRANEIIGELERKLSPVCSTFLESVDEQRPQYATKLTEYLESVVDRLSSLLKRVSL